MKRLVFFLALILSFIHSVKASTDTTQQKIKWQLDSNYVISYPEKLVVGLFQSYRYYDLFFRQGFTLDSSGTSLLNYIARGNNSTGISFAWDKISFSLSSSVDATESDVFRKGISKTKNLSLSINSKRYRLEAAYRKYTGFYDNYTPSHDTTYVTDSSAYYQIPSMYSKEFRLKGFYFFNKKKRYSYGAAFNNTARQLKTAGSFLLVSNLYGFSLGADSSMIHPGTSNYYPGWENFNYFKSLGVSVNLGYSFTLVLFKRFFAHATGTLGMELQNRNYSTSDGVNQIKDWNLGWSAGDLRGSIGYNGERFFMMLTYIGDFNVYRLKSMEIDSKLHAGAFTFGYRFNFKENKVTRWLKNNKLYQLL